MVAKKRGLGRGLEALLPKERTPEASATGLDEISVEFIRPGRYQPRSHFSEDSIAELADSIRAQGVMQPIVLRSTGNDSYEIIAGERRWRASQLAGLEKIPAIIRTADDESALAMSLIENIQREDLGPLEEAVALQRLIDDFQLTHQEVAQAVGKSRSSVTNTLRLNSLEPGVAELLQNGDIEMGHARALLTLEAGLQRQVAGEIVGKGLNVRQAEALVRNAGQPRKAKNRSVDADTRRLEENLGMSLGQPVKISHTAKGKGKLIISYSTLDELDGILSKMGYED